MGVVAARILLQRIAAGNIFRYVSIMPELVIRESTCPPSPGARAGSGVEDS